MKMKNKILLFFLALFITGSALAQTGSFNNVQVHNNLRLKGRTIYKFANDSAFVAADSNSVPTAWAVKAYLLNRLGNLTIATGNTYVVSSEAGMLALDAGVGDVAVRSDSSKSFILQTLPATELTNWILLLFPNNVPSVFGRTGPVTAQAGDYGHSDITGVDSMFNLKQDAIANLADTSLYAKKRDSAIFSTVYQNSLKANDASVVHKSGDEDIGGGKTIVDSLRVPTRLKADSSANAASTAWVKSQTYLAAIGIIPNKAIPYVNSSGLLTYDAAGLYWDGSNLNAGHSDFYSTTGLGLNGGRGFIGASGFGMQIKTNGGVPMDASKSISFYNSSTRYGVFRMRSQWDSTLQFLSDMEIVPNGLDNLNLGSLTNPWNDLYAKQVNINSINARADININGNIIKTNEATRVDPNSLYATNAPTYLAIPTYDGSGQAVHPDVYYNANGKFEYKWWMVMEPYPNTSGRYEKVSLIASQDGVNWVVPSGITNPIEPTTSDTNDIAPDGDLIEGIDGKLYVIYTISSQHATYARSYDGTAVSEKVKLFDWASAKELSPAVTFEDGKYIMRYVNAADSPYVISKRSATNILGPWTTEPNDTILNMAAGMMIWHMDVIKEGDELHGFFTLEKGVTNTQTKLYFATCNDGHTWRLSDTSLLNTKVGSWDDLMIYRSSAVAVKGSKTKYKLYYSAITYGSDEWHIGVTDVKLKDEGSVDTTNAITGLATNYKLSKKADANSVVRLTGNDVKVGTLAIQSGSSVYGLRVGADNLATTLTANVAKSFRVVMPSYDLSTNNIIFSSLALSKNSVALYLGGSNFASGLAPFSNISFMTGSPSTNGSSAVRLGIDSLGNISIPTIPNAIGNYIMRNASSGNLTERTPAQVVTDLNLYSKSQVDSARNKIKDSIMAAIAASYVAKTDSFHVIAGRGLGVINDTILFTAPHVTSYTSATSINVNADTTDMVTITALAAGVTFNNPTGTLLDGQTFRIRIRDNGTARSISFGTAYRFSTDLPAPSTTILSKTMYLQFIWNASDSKWDCIHQLNNF